MSKSPQPFLVTRRKDAKTFPLTLNVSCGLPSRVCREWIRRSFQNLPDVLAAHRQPKSKAAATIGALALIAYLKNNQTVPVVKSDVTVGQWLELFTALETSPRAARNVARNRPNSIDTIADYESYYRLHVKDDAFSDLKMDSANDEDALLLLGRLGARQLHAGRPMAGTRTYEAVIKFVRMAFHEYGRTRQRWINPFQHLDPPQGIRHGRSDTLTDNEVVRLFAPGVLLDGMERGVCAAMFLAGLRRAEIVALKPEGRDWKTPKLTVRRAWQKFDYNGRVLGPTKSKREREAPFDGVLQQAVRKLWEENGRREFVFRFKGGKMPTPHWWNDHFHRWLERAGIDTGGRKIVPHSSRHSLASTLEARNVPLRYIQELLGHRATYRPRRYTCMRPPAR
ncbi:MAG: tyrosine-type recombinase/integrase [Treponema sp.]|jgi:integrase|nr:tyrosine-type recombinase/integrase [Treponema sp.]